MTKKPRRSKKPPEINKLPRRSQDPKSTDNETIVWHINTVDEGGEWGWRKLDANTLWGEIFSKIKNFETMKWSEIKGPQSHTVSVSKISNAAQKRIFAIFKQIFPCDISIVRICNFRNSTKMYYCFFSFSGLFISLFCLSGVHIL